MADRDFGGSSSGNRDYQGHGGSQEGRRWESSDRESNRDNNRDNNRDQQRDQYRDRNRENDRGFDQQRDQSGRGFGGYGGSGGYASGHVEDRSGYPGGSNYQGAGGSHADLGDRNPSQGFTGGFGGGTSDRSRGDAGGSYASSNPNAGMGMGGSYYGQGSSNHGFGQSGSHSGLGQSHGQSGSSQSYAGRGSKNYRRSDARIEEEVHEVLLRHHEIDATDIDVKVENGEVTLSGETEDRRSKRLVEEIVEQCQGVREVHNNIKARRGLLGSIGTALSGESESDRSDRDVTSKTMSASRENKSR